MTYDYLHRVDMVHRRVANNVTTDIHLGKSTKCNDVNACNISIDNL